MSKKLALVVIYLFLFYTASQAQRKYVNEYLNIGTGGAGLAMGGAQVASVSDVTGGFWNPAGLRGMPSDFQFSAMHSDYFGGIAKYDYGALAYKLNNNKSNVGFSFIRFAVDDIPYTINIMNIDGTIDYSKLSSISSADYAAIISYARDFTPKRFKDNEEVKMAYGINAKILYRHIGDMANAWGIGVDGGLQMKYKRWRFGGILKDATTTVTAWSFSLTDKEKLVFERTKNTIPLQSSEVMLPRLTLGVARNFPIGNRFNAMAEINTEITSDGGRYGYVIQMNPFSIDPRIGVELNYNKTIYLRGGVNNFQNVKNALDTTYQKKYTIFQPSFGLGLNISNFTLEYSFSSLNLQDNPLYTNVISMKLDIRKPKKFRKSLKKK